MSQGAAAAGERSIGHRGNVYFLLKPNPKLVSDHPESGRSETQLGIECLGRGALSILRGGEGEFDGEFDGNSREFDAGFGEFDVFSMLAEL